MKHQTSILIPFLLSLPMIIFGQGVGINPSGNAPNASAGLDIDFNDRGVLIPRVSTSERDDIQSPAEGLMVFNTDTKCINLFESGNWKQSCFDCGFSLPLTGNNGPVCEGNTLNLTASSIPGATYSWTGPNGFTSNQQNPSIFTATVAASGVYMVTATVNGCTSSPALTIASVNAAPVAPSAGNGGPICHGQTLNLTAGSIIGASYSWNGPNGFSSSQQNPVIPNATTAASGTYTVTATVNGCTGNTGSTSATVHALPNAGWTSNPSSPSPVTNQTVVFSPNTGGGTYSWTFQSGSITTSTSGSPSVSWNTAGSYNVGLSLTDANGCSNSATSQITIATPVDKIVFVTSTFYTGNLGGVSGANSICQTRASSASLSGTFKAWISDATTNPNNSFVKNNGPYKLRDGSVVANNWADLTDGTLNTGINRTESNGTVSGTGVLTNTNSSGGTLSTVSGDKCNFFTSASSSATSQHGSSGQTSSAWTQDSSSALCNNSSFWRLYCFQQ